MFDSAAGVRPSQMKGSDDRRFSIRVPTASTVGRRSGPPLARTMADVVAAGRTARCGVPALVTNTTRADDETPVPAAAGYVVDTTSSISTADRERLVGMARQINQSTGAQLFTVV